MKYKNLLVLTVSFFALSGCLDSMLKQKEDYVNPTMLNTVGKSIDIVLERNELYSRKGTFGGYVFWSEACRETGNVNTYRNNAGGYSSYAEKRCGSARFTTDNNQIITDYEENGAYIPILNPVVSTYRAIAFDSDHNTFALSMSQPKTNANQALAEAVSQCVSLGGKQENCNKEAKTFSNTCLSVSTAIGKKDNKSLTIFWVKASTKAQAEEESNLDCRKRYLDSAVCKVSKSACAY